MMNLSHFLIWRKSVKKSPVFYLFFRLSSPNSHYDSDIDNNILKLNNKIKYTTNEKIKQTNTSSQIKEYKETILNHIPDVGLLTILSILM